MAHYNLSDHSDALYTLQQAKPEAKAQYPREVSILDHAAHSYAMNGLGPSRADFDLALETLREAPQYSTDFEAADSQSGGVIRPADAWYLRDVQSGRRVAHFLPREIGQNGRPAYFEMIAGPTEILTSGARYATQREARDAVERYLDSLPA